MTHDIGMPAVQPSTERPTSWVACAVGPAISSTSRRRTPVHLVLPTRCPPTSLLTHAIVQYCSNIGSEISWSQVSVVSRSTRPWMRSCHVAVSSDGHEERRVDAVEVVVRHDDRRQPGGRRREVGLGGEWRDDVDRRRQRRRRRGRARARCDRGTTERPDRERADPDGSRSQQERASGRVRDGRPAFGWAESAEQPGQGLDGDATGRAPAPRRSPGSRAAGRERR